MPHRGALGALLVSTAARAYEFPRFRGTYGSDASEHERFGREMGARFADFAARRVRDGGTATVAAWIMGDGADAYARLAAAANASYPLLVAELRGLAEGSGQSHEVIFAQNFREELGYYYPGELERIDHCSDYALSPTFLAHNEDGNPVDSSTVFLVDVSIDGGRFAALTYTRCRADVSRLFDTADDPRRRGRGGAATPPLQKPQSRD